MKHIHEIELLLQGLPTEAKKHIDHTFNELNTSKETANDLLYKEAKQKISNMNNKE